jgi:hypothetical protein
VTTLRQRRRLREVNRPADEPLSPMRDLALVMAGAALATIAAAVVLFALFI